MDFGVWVSIFATVVAVASAAISRHNSRLSVRPVMGFWVQSDHGTHRLILANKGNGPAIIESATFEPVGFDHQYGEVTTENIAGLFFRFSIANHNPYDLKIEQALPLSAGRMLGAGDELDVCRFIEKVGSPEFDSGKREQWVKSFNLHVNLKDMFDERWQVTLKDGKSSFSRKMDF